LQAKAGDHHTLLGLDLLVAPANFHRDTSSGDEVLQFKLEAAGLFAGVKQNSTHLVRLLPSEGL
jgi:hypothetical protein